MPTKPAREAVLGTARITLCDIKEPDVFFELCDKLKVSDAKREKFLEFGEYASIELVVDRNFNIVGGRFLPWLGSRGRGGRDGRR